MNGLNTGSATLLEDRLFEATGGAPTGSHCLDDLSEGDATGGALEAAAGELQVAQLAGQGQITNATRGVLMRLLGELAAGRTDGEGSGMATEDDEVVEVGVIFQARHDKHGQLQQAGQGVGISRVDLPGLGRYTGQHQGLLGFAKGYQ